jgi:hypothetical protein
MSARCAVSARYHSAEACVVVELDGGSTLHIPASSIHGLEEAPDAVRAAIEVTPNGSGIFWTDLDVDLNVGHQLATAAPGELLEPEGERRRKRS